MRRTYGNGTPVFITEHEGSVHNSPEFVAAMYESDAAEHESYADQNDYSAGHYAISASLAAEHAEHAMYKDTCPYCGILSADMDNHLQYCEPMDR